MATNYLVKYTDTDVPSITVPGHKVNDTALDVTLFGRIRLEYGDKLNEDLLNILENFTLPEDPSSTSDNVFPLFSQASNNQLANPTPGQFWFNNTRSQMFYWTGLEWRGISSSNDTYAANWGQLTHGQQIPRPVSGVSGRIFEYTDCIWSVSPANITGKFAVLNCTSDADAVVTMQYRYSGSPDMLNGIANYLIIGIVGNDNAGSYSTAPNPSITPTRSPTPTPAATHTPTPTVTQTIGVTPTPQPTTTRTPTPTATVTVTPTRTITPTPAVTSTMTPTPTITPTVSSIVLAKITNVDVEGIAPGVSVVDYILNSDGINYISTTAGGTNPNETWRYVGSSTDYEVRASVLSGAVDGGSVTSAWLSLGGTQQWSVSSAGNNQVELLVEIRRTSDGVILTTASVQLLATTEE